VKPKHQRLVLVSVAFAAILGSGVLAVVGLKDQAAYFYSPADLAKTQVADGQAIRLGGMVADKSIKRQPDGVSITFIVEDGPHQVPVRFRGIAPDLFKEKSGVIAEGAFEGKVFVANTILAKHDERYMPPQLAGKMHKTSDVQ
jgi:cytochrome c-type biogenesis protein CcmE